MQMKMIHIYRCARLSLFFTKRCKQAVGGQPPRYAPAQVTITVCPCWPASTTKQTGLVTLTFDLLTESDVQVTWPLFSS